MQPYHVQAVIDKEGKIVLSLPFPAGKRVDVVVTPFDDRGEQDDWSQASMLGALRGFEDDPVTYSKEDVKRNDLQGR